MLKVEPHFTLLTETSTEITGFAKNVQCQFSFCPTTHISDCTNKNRKSVEKFLLVLKVAESRQVFVRDYIRERLEEEQWKLGRERTRMTYK